jgi:hypothetical protein
VFDQLREAVFPLDGGERGQKGRIDKDRVRMMQRANQVFAVLGVQPGLSAHRCVDHRQERRGNIDVGDATQQRRGDKAGQIERNATTERDDAQLPVDGQREQGIFELLFGLPDFMGLAGSKGEPNDARGVRAERLFDLVAVKLHHVFVGDQGAVSPLGLPNVG